MLFKLLSGDLISANSMEELSDTLGVPAFRIHIVKESDDLCYAVVQDHPHHCSIYYNGSFDGEESYMIRVQRYEGEFPYQDRENWDWVTWDFYFYYNRFYRVEEDRYTCLSDALKALITRDAVPEDTGRYVMDEAQRLWDSLKSDEFFISVS